MHGIARGPIMLFKTALSVNTYWGKESVNQI
jgi:hypothetical protein